MLFLAAATPGGVDSATLTSWVQSFLPLKALVTVVDQAMPVFDLIGAFLIIVATVQEIPKSRGADLLTVVLRAAVLLLMMVIITSLMWFSEVSSQSLVKAIASNSGANGQNFVANTPPAPQIGQVPDAATRAEILYNFNLDAMFNGLQAPNQPNGPTLFGFIPLPQDPISSVVDEAKYLFQLLIFGLIGIVVLFSAFVMIVMLFVQKAILIFSRLLMPCALGILSWQGATRFLGINYIQSVLGVTCWPIGWGLIYVGTVAAMQNLTTQFNNFSKTTDLGTLIFIFINVFLICVWMVIGTIMAPGLIMKVITAGGNFAASAMGAVSGKTIGAAGEAVKGAAQATGAIAGAAVGAMAGNPLMGAQIGGQIGGSVGGAAAAPASSMASSVSQATGEGGGGGGVAPTNASSAAGFAALQGLAQMGKGQ